MRNVLAIPVTCALALVFGGGASRLASPGLRELGSIPGFQGVVFRQTVEQGKAARLVRLAPDGSLRLLSGGFHSASDPDISFDGKRILFAAKRHSADPWQIFEMSSDGSGVRQITREKWDCRSPVYQSTIYVITADEPWRHIIFVGYKDGVTSLYSTKLDGSATQRLTYNPYGDRDPFLAPDGRVLYAAAQKDRVPLFGVNPDGTDHAMFSGDDGARIKRMPCTTAKGLAVFVESERQTADGSGALAAVSLHRSLHSYRRLAKPSGGLFHSPSPLPDGTVLVSRRPAAGAGTYGIYRFDPESGTTEPLYDDPQHDDIQPKLLAPRREPDGRSSVVDESEASGALYCLNVYTTDRGDDMRPPAGKRKRLRVLEGIMGPKLGLSTAEPPARLLGEIEVEDDGSFHVRVPANVPIRLELLGAGGAAERSCSWIWVRNKEPRGCIGCHEDGELAPENRVVEALRKPPVDFGRRASGGGGRQ